MQFALVDAERRLPEPRLRGVCPLCGREAVAKCGSKVRWHWAHYGRRHCDSWWENETDWHRAWKLRFPESTREVVHIDVSTGEKHVADLKTPAGLVIELQHSAMPPEELHAREAFYGQMIWIVDGRPFARHFEIVEDPLPYPDSTLLQDVVFFPNLASAFWRKSETATGSKLVKMHRSAEIVNEIAADYRGHHFFRWKHARRMWLEATAPVFVDFGSADLLRLGMYGESGQRCVQRIAKRALVEENGGTYEATRIG